jgi:hypothetical protein
MAELQIADVRAQVIFSLFTDFENFTVFKPASHKEESVNEMLDQLIPGAVPYNLCASGRERLLRAVNRSSFPNRPVTSMLRTFQTIDRSFPKAS